MKKETTIQVQIIAIIEKKVSADSLEDALTIGNGLSWSDIFPGTEIADGTFKVIGVFGDWYPEEK